MYVHDPCYIDVFGLGSSSEYVSTVRCCGAAVLSGLDGVHSGPDAVLSGPDAVHSGPDAAHSEPDAVLSGPDAVLSGPDAVLSGPDAVHSRPDASRAVHGAAGQTLFCSVTPMSVGRNWRCSFHPRQPDGLLHYSP